MHPRSITLSAAIVSLLVLASQPAYADKGWKELANLKSGSKHAIVELKEGSLKRRSKQGETILTFTLKQQYTENGGHIESLADYEVQCAKRKATRSNLVFEAREAGKIPNRTRIPNSEELTGKEYDDFQGVMNILCTGDA